MRSHGSAGKRPERKLRPLNRPRPARVSVNERGIPTRVRSRDRWRPVRSVLETWRIDDEWWRESISREYFSLLLEGGAQLTVYQDLVEGRWYTQPE